MSVMTRNLRVPVRKYIQYSAENVNISTWNKVCTPMNFGRANWYIPYHVMHYILTSHKFLTLS